jgi:MFS family permease
MISDMWDANTRGKALGFFTLAPFAGPALGPTVSGFMAVAGVSWRWVYWVMTIFAGVCGLLLIFTIPETFTYVPPFILSNACVDLYSRPYLLVQRAKLLRKETGDDRYWAPLEKNKLTFRQRLEQTLLRPFKIFFREPMLVAVTLYMSVSLSIIPSLTMILTSVFQFVYGCIYILFEAYPIVFTEGHHFNAGISGLMFLPLFIGGALAVIIYLLWWNPRYERLALEFAPNPVPPEYRLEQALWAAPLFAVSFFWFGWTSYPSLSYWGPATAGGGLGFATIWIFLALFNYIIDAYLFVAASALAANTVVRSLFGAGFPLFATQMFEVMNPRWASTLLGFVAIALGPIPFVLRQYGPILRRKSKYAPTLPPKAPKKAEETV